MRGGELHERCIELHERTVSYRELHEKTESYIELPESMVSDIEVH